MYVNDQEQKFLTFWKHYIYRTGISLDFHTARSSQRTVFRCMSAVGRPQDTTTACQMIGCSFH
jgi:hypothetical protein